jgi:acetolactate decarboxylase
MPQLNCTVSPGLWALLQEQSQRTQQPVALIVSKALADYLDVAHHTLYQVSTATALVEGIYQGAVRVGTLRERGDLGLGTFEIWTARWWSLTGISFKCDVTARCRKSTMVF